MEGELLLPLYLYRFIRLDFVTVNVVVIFGYTIIILGEYIMIFIFVAFALIVPAEIFLIKFYYDGEKLFKKYDKDHSNVQCVNVEEFVSRIKAFTEWDTSKVECNGNKVNLVYQKNKYVINIEDGIAAVEYDRRGCGIKISGIGRIFKIFRFHKAIKKAAAINNVMDSLAGKNTEEGTKGYKKIKNDWTMLGILFFAMIAFYLIGMFNIIKNIHEEGIERVKNIEFLNGITYGELVHGYIREPEWTAFNSDKDVAIIEVNGKSVEGEEICIQFGAEGREGFNLISSQNFRPIYFEADGESLDTDAAFLYLYEYLYEEESKGVNNAESEREKKPQEMELLEKAYLIPEEFGREETVAEVLSVLCSDEKYIFGEEVDGKIDIEYNAKTWWPDEKTDVKLLMTLDISDGSVIPNKLFFNELEMDPRFMESFIYKCEGYDTLSQDLLDQRANGETGSYLEELNQMEEEFRKKALAEEENFRKELERFFEENAYEESEVFSGKTIDSSDIFVSEPEEEVSWYSDTTKYYMIPYMSDGNPMVIFSDENNSYNYSMIYYASITSVEYTEKGGLVCSGEMFMNINEPENRNGIVEITWDSFETIDSPSVRVLGEDQTVDRSMEADDYYYWGPLESISSDEDTEFVFPDSNLRLLTESDINGKSAEELRIAKNEIYARHGRIFISEDLREYFESKSWYQGYIPADQFNESFFNEVEKENIIFIQRYIDNPLNVANDSGYAP